jgi:hypothetical protein
MATDPNAPIPEVIAVEMAKDREVRREERMALTAIPATDLTQAAQRTSFMPQSMGEAMQLANIMARSSFVPQHCRGNEGNCLAIIMQASRWGMDPFAVANKAYFVKDGAPPAFESQLVNAVVNGSGALSGRLRVQFEGEGEKLRCTVSGFLRADPNDEKVKTQSIARITTRNSPLWKSDPEQQLMYYTTRAWARAWVPEVLLGVYTPEEIDVQPERARNVTPPAAMPTRESMSRQAVTYDDRDRNEETERQLDAQAFRQADGYVDDQPQDEEEVDNHPSGKIANDTIAKIERAEVMGDVLGAEAEFKKHIDAMREGDVERVNIAIANGKLRFKPATKTKAQQAEGGEA